MVIKGNTWSPVCTIIISSVCDRIYIKLKDLQIIRLFAKHRLQDEWEYRDYIWIGPIYKIMCNSIRCSIHSRANQSVKYILDNWNVAVFTTKNGSEKSVYHAWKGSLHAAMDCYLLELNISYTWNYVMEWNELFFSCSMFIKLPRYISLPILLCLTKW